MKTIGRKLIHLSLALILATGATVTLSGCERESPVEEAAEEVGEAVEEAGETVSGQR